MLKSKSLMELMKMKLFGVIERYYRYSTLVFFSQRKQRVMGLLARNVETYRGDWVSFSSMRCVFFVRISFSLLPNSNRKNFYNSK